MTAGWEIKNLGELTDLITKGTTPTSVGFEFVDEGINFIKVESITESGQFIEQKLASITQECHNALSRSQIKEGDILFSIAGALGRTAMATTDVLPANTNQALAIIRLKTSSDVLPSFILKALGTGFVLEQIEKSRGGVAQQNLSLAQVRDFQIPIPPIAEQKRIVTILDQVFEGIATATANAEKNLANARELFESTLQSIFAVKGEGWLDTTIGEQIRFIDYRGKTPKKTDSGLRLITAKNVKMGFLQDEPMEYVSPDAYDAWMTRGIPRCGDVLFTTEAPLANVAQLDTDAKVMFAQRIIIMQSDPSTLDSTFLKYMLLSQPVQQRIHAKGTGATVKGIKASLLRTVQISFPKSVAVQQAIVAMLDELSTETKKLETIYQQKLVALEELKKSILNQAFTGQLH